MGVESGERVAQSAGDEEGMSVLVTRAEKAAFESVGRDRHLLSDKASEERISDSCAGQRRANETMTDSQRRSWLDARMKAGK
jgi:hypothetical protein